MEKGNKTKIIVTKKVKCIHPVVENIAKNLAEIDAIQFIKISPEFLQASSETTHGRIKTLITEPGHPTAIGVSLIVDISYKSIQFFEITSAIKGYGSKMVDAVLKDLPKDWRVDIVMDWSNGFWDKMKKRYKKIKVW